MLCFVLRCFVCLFGGLFCFVLCSLMVLFGGFLVLFFFFWEGGGGGVRLMLLLLLLFWLFVLRPCKRQSVSRGQVCFNNFSCCHTWTEDTDQTCYVSLTQRAQTPRLTAVALILYRQTIGRAGGRKPVTGMTRPWLESPPPALQTVTLTINWTPKRSNRIRNRSRGGGTVTYRLYLSHSLGAKFLTERKISHRCDSNLTADGCTDPHAVFLTLQNSGAYCMIADCQIYNEVIVSEQKSLWQRCAMHAVLLVCLVWATTFSKKNAYRVLMNQPTK